MFQLTQKLGSGEMLVQEVPPPMCQRGMVLVRNHYSVISGGTEGATVMAARKGLIGKAMERPQQVRQVLETLRSQGLVQTWRAVEKKLDAYSPLGYSSSGEVVEVGEGVTEFRLGDLVACGGAGYANHAELVAVPVNLCVKLGPDADLKLAAFNTLGAISMQGVRQAGLQLGETCVVVGLGLLGQIACLLLREAGVTVIGVDVQPGLVSKAQESGVVDQAFARSTVGLEEKIRAATGGIGADGVLIAAATDSTDPINLAGALARQRGRVVVLGAVPTGFDRDPYWYRKELELRMACSYGPGRYDPDYEVKGIDYPVAYVRWTQKRNMESFQRLLERRALDVGKLCSHEFSFEDAPKAFDLIAGKVEPYLGIVLRYDSKREVTLPVVPPLKKGSIDKGALSISFIGAGSYAQSHLLPHISKRADIERVAVLSSTGTTSKRVAERFGFERCVSSEAEVFGERTDVVFIATRHDSHARYVKSALASGKHVFVEKPLCLLTSELDEISDLVADGKGSVMVGFNRRFSPLALELRQFIGDGPVSMNYRVNAGHIPLDSWIQDPDLGGGRIIGEACHFVDLMSYISGSLPQTVSAHAMTTGHGALDTVNILIGFVNGSTGVLSYFANGPKNLPKERLEVFGGGRSGILDDFRGLSCFTGKRVRRKRRWTQNKGQREMVDAFIKGLLESGGSVIPFEDINAVTRTCLLAVESLSCGGELRRV